MSMDKRITEYLYTVETVEISVIPHTVNGIGCICMRKSCVFTDMTCHMLFLVAS